MEDISITQWLRLHNIFISIRINIQKAKYMDFYAINIFITYGCNSGYLLLLCHEPLETIVFNSQFYGHLRSITLSWKSVKILQRQLMLSVVFCGQICLVISYWFRLECLKFMKYKLCTVNPELLMF